MEQKKSAISDLTQSVREILSFYDGQAKDGIVPVAVAKELAVSQIRQLRYGPKGKTISGSTTPGRDGDAPFSARPRGARRLGFL